MPAPSGRVYATYGAVYIAAALSDCGRLTG